METGNNIITGEKFEITGRGTVFLCENCTYDKGDKFCYEDVWYEIRGIEMYQHETKPYKRVGLLVRVVDTPKDCIVIPVEIIDYLNQPRPTVIDQIEQYIDSIQKEKQYLEALVLSYRNKLKNYIVTKQGEAIKSLNSDLNVPLELEKIVGAVEELIEEYDNHFKITTQKQGQV